MTKASSSLVALMAITMHQGEGKPPIEVAPNDTFEAPAHKRQWLIDSKAAATSKDAAKLDVETLPG